MKLLPALAGLFATANASLDMTNLDMPNDDGKKSLSSVFCEAVNDSSFLFYFGLKSVIAIEARHYNG